MGLGSGTKFSYSEGEVNKEETKKPPKIKKGGKK
jgi:hypothetical protein